MEHRLARLDLVKRRVEEIEPHPADVAELAQHLDLEVRVAFELIEQVDRRGLEEVDLARLQRRHRGLLIGDVLVDDAVDLRDLAAGHAGRRLRARHVVRVLVVDVAVARLVSSRLKVKGPEPMYSVTCWFGSVSASFLRIMYSSGVEVFAITSMVSP